MSQSAALSHQAVTITLGRMTQQFSAIVDPKAQTITIDYLRDPST